MGFLDIGPLELLLIMVVILIIFGPGKIPEIARTIGKTMRALRKATSDLTTTVTRELNVEEERERLSKLQASEKLETGKPSDTSKAESVDTGTNSTQDGQKLTAK